MTIVRTLEVFDACDKLTPLHWAALCDGANDVCQLLQAGADANINAVRKPPALKRLWHRITQRATPATENWVGPLSLALARRRPDIVITLLQAGATPHSDDHNQLQRIITADDPRMLRDMLAAGMELGEEVRHGHHDPFHQTDGYLEQALQGTR